MLLEKQRMQQLELEERQRRRSIKEKDHGRSDGWLSPPPTASKPGSARSSTSMPDINQQKTSSTKGNQHATTTQRVPLHTLLARQQAYLEARRRRTNNRVPLKLRATSQPTNSYAQHQQHQHQQFHPHPSAIVQPQNVYRRIKNSQPDPFNLRYASHSNNISQQTSHNLALMEQQQQHQQQHQQHQQQQHQQQQQQQQQLQQLSQQQHLSQQQQQNLRHYHTQQQIQAQQHSSHDQFQATGGHFGNTSFHVPAMSGPSRVNFNFPDISYQNSSGSTHQKVIQSKAQTELNESIQKAQQVYEDVIRSKKEVKATLNRNGKIVNSNQHHAVNGGSSVVRLERERTMALQALQAALSGRGNGVGNGIGNGVGSSSGGDGRKFSSETSADHQFRKLNNFTKGTSHRKNNITKRGRKSQRTGKKPGSTKRGMVANHLTNSSQRRNYHSDQISAKQQQLLLQECSNSTSNGMHRSNDDEMGLSNYGTKFRSKLVHVRAGQNALDNQQRSNTAMETSHLTSQHQQPINMAIKNNNIMRKSMSAENPSVFFQASST